MPKIELGNVRYNAKDSAFEARVDVSRDGKTFRYPCVVKGPLNMEISRVRAHLARRALQMSDSGARLHSHL